MMSDEEKKAIEIIKNEITRPDTTPLEVYVTDIKILLNLIKKQQKEIEEWQKAYINNDNYWDKFRDKINKIANNNKDCSDNAVIKAVKELKDKNASLQKEIKLMKSININDNYISKDKIKNKIKEIEDYMILFTNDKEKFNRYKYTRDTLEKLLEEE